MKIWSVLLAMVLGLGALNAEAAKRLGGGGSFGKQSGNVAQRQNAAPPTAPAQNALNKPGAPAQPMATPPQKRPWGAMLGGLAAGLGLAWLAHSLGLGAEFGQFLMMALLVAGALVLWGIYRRSRSAAGDSGASGPYAYSGAAGPAPGRAYNPAHVGNDASARPWEGQAQTFQGTAPSSTNGSVIGSALGGTPSELSGQQTWGIPVDFDTTGFLSAAKRNFVTLQAAWDRSDIDTLRSMMTDDMALEIKTQLAERAMHTGMVPNQTEVITLDAKLLGIEELPSEYLASVEFSGVIQESPTDGPSPFREVWNMSRIKNGQSGWLVAGVQALQ